MSALALLLLALFVGAGSALWARSSLTKWRLKRRFQHASNAEKRAIRFAREAGFQVVGTQVPRTLTIWVDGEPRRLRVRADMVLRRWGRRYVAEVKTGKRATDPTNRATRRQLQEYSYAFNARRILLFDMEQRRIHEIRFSHARSGLHWIPIGLLMLLGGAVLERSFGFLQALR